jgi:hypothetical protein
MAAQTPFDAGLRVDAEEDVTEAAEEMIVFLVNSVEVRGVVAVE